MCLLCEMCTRDEAAALPDRAARRRRADGPDARVPGVRELPPDHPRVGPCRAAAKDFRADAFTGERRARLVALQRGW